MTTIPPELESCPGLAPGSPVPPNSLSGLCFTSRTTVLALAGIVASLLPGRLDAAPPELMTQGNKVVVKSTGQPIRLVGVNIPSLEWGNGDHLSQSTTEAINNWKCNLIRLPVDRNSWNGANGAAYKAIVDGVVNQISAANKYVILDNHGYVQPETADTTFWTNAATRYRDNPAVLFGLLNEPHDTTWDVWKNGDATHPGLQAILNTVRATGAKNVAVVGGLDYAYLLAGLVNTADGTVSSYALSDASGNGIIYDTHIYPWKKYWASSMGNAANIFPVIVGEVGHPGQTTYPGVPGSFDAHGVWVPRMMDFIDSLNLNWTGWAFFPGATPPGLPSMIADWSYTPTAWWGAPAKSSLLSYQTPTATHVIGGTIITGTADVSTRFVYDRGATMVIGIPSKIFRSNVATGGWVGVDLGKAHRVTRIDYMPAGNNGAKMVGGIFQGSNSADFSSGVVNLFTVATAPLATGYVYTTANVSDTGTYRYVRYLGPTGQYCWVDELKFFGQEPASGAVPPPWASQYIGTVGAVGSSSYSGGIFTLNGGGKGFDPSTTDAFQYVYQTASGDCTMTARVASLSQAPDGIKGEAGVMIRETLSNDSRFALAGVTTGRGLRFQYRTSPGATSVLFAGTGGIVAPYWVRVTRVGDTFTTHTSANGSTWTQMGTPQTIAMATNVYIGMVIGHWGGGNGVATFDSLTTTP